MAAFPLANYSTSIKLTYLNGLSKIENFPLLEARATSTKEFVYLVRILNLEEQFDMFTRATILIIDTPNTALLYNVALSLLKLEPRIIPSYTCYLIDNARRST